MFSSQHPNYGNSQAPMAHQPDQYGIPKDLEPVEESEKDKLMMKVERVQFLTCEFRVVEEQSGKAVVFTRIHVQTCVMLVQGYCSFVVSESRWWTN
ncbi:hypothetical protein P7K49_008848 [Saguinus oedipus]|uniref:Uncharacterized protein n=1 Tax=Saguinus oedipus TaxID=9490 RepID=A0ABQ9VYY8_SAGOE|nr:hypothetical protein P7K49_008848 [Saguinus oedipus]